MKYSQLVNAAKESAEKTGNSPRYDVYQLISGLTNAEKDELISDMAKKSKRFETPYVAVSTGTHKRTGEKLSESEIEKLRARAVNRIADWASSDLR